MALCWSILDVPNHLNTCYIAHEGDGEPDESCYSEHDDGVWRRFNPVTDALIWATLSVDMGSIKASNLDEWLYRLKVSEALYGVALSSREAVPRPLTMDDLIDHVGLWTNVHTETTTKWAKRLHDAFVRPVRKSSRNHRSDSSYRYTRYAKKALAERADAVE